jgi:hypothetical protein
MWDFLTGFRDENLIVFFTLSVNGQRTEQRTRVTADSA